MDHVASEYQCSSYQELTTVTLLFNSTHDATFHFQRIQNYTSQVIVCIS